MSKVARSAAILLAFAVAASAQSASRDWNNVKIMTTGTEVRIKLASATLRGQLQGVTDDTLTMYSGKGSQTIMRSEIVRLSIKKRGHRGRNTLIGLGTGVAVGAIIGTASHSDCTGWCIFSTSRGQDAAIGAVVAGLLGTLVGVALPTGGWREIYAR